jgi:hypothetical protein
VDRLVGDTHILGPGEGGTVFEVMPSGGSWTFQVLYLWSAKTSARSSNDLIQPIFVM